MQKASPTRLTDEQIAQFHEQGFLVINEPVCSAEELLLLNTIFSTLFSHRAGWGEGAQFDLLAPEQNADSRLREIMYPVNFAPELRNIAYRRNALAIAKQLLGSRAAPVFEHAVLKPARQGAEIPWHQDEAYRGDPDWDYQQLSIWLPLQPVTRENGCLWYIPASHRLEVLPHRPYRDDLRAHALECIGEFDALGAVDCPLPAGGVAMHHGRTLHYTGPNNTDLVRVAYVLVFELPPKRTARRREFEWNRKRNTEHMQRRQAWFRKGGIALEIMRRVRYRKMLRHPGRLVFEMRRVLRALLGRFTLSR